MRCFAAGARRDPEAADAPNTTPKPDTDDY
jgi:hypothetical protein